MGLRLKVSFDRLEKLGIEPTIPGLQEDCNILLNWPMYIKIFYSGVSIPWILTLVLLNPDISSLEKGVDADQVPSDETISSGSNLISMQPYAQVTHSWTGCRISHGYNPASFVEIRIGL